VSDLLRAVGAEMDYEVVFDEDRVKSNIYNSSSLPAMNSTFTRATASANLVKSELEKL